MSAWADGFPNKLFVSDDCHTLPDCASVRPRSAYVAAIAALDSYLSSTPKFVLGLGELFDRYPHAKWFGLWGDDNFVLRGGLLARLAKFDSSSEVVVGGHVGSHLGSIPFVSGGGGLVFSNAAVRKLRPRLEDFALRWLTNEGGRSVCFPCGDLALLHLAAEEGVGVVVEDGFFAKWPSFYCGGTLLQPKWRQFDVRAFNAGGSEWGHLYRLVTPPVSFHYLGLRSLQYLAASFDHMDAL